MNDSAHEDVMVDWFGVRCIFKDSDAGTYEERITLWKACGFAEAVSLAEAEALEYAEILDGVSYIGLAQGFSLAGEPGHGNEVFSLIRDSSLSEEEYLSTFFDTGDERQGYIEE
jgi:hypothetical protein